MLSLGLTILVWGIIACVAVPLAFLLLVWIANVLTPSRIPPQDRDIDGRIEKLTAIERTHWAKLEAIGY